MIADARIRAGLGRAVISSFGGENRGLRYVMVSALKPDT
jgi:hypothetical protein